jgi:hypothetical protein
VRARTIVVPALVAVLVIVLAACSSPPPISDPAAVVAAIPAAASHAGAVRFVEVTSAPGVHSTLTGQLSAKNTDDAQEHLVQGKSELDLERVGDVLYLRASSEVLQGALQISPQQAAAYAGKWVSITPGDLLFPQISNTLALGAEVAAFMPVGSQIHTSAERTLGHVTVVPITGAPSPSTAQGARGELTLFVSPSGAHLPAGANLVLRRGSKSESRIVVFTDWGKPVKLTAPTGATPYQKIATAPAG